MTYARFIPVPCACTSTIAGRVDCRQCVRSDDAGPVSRRMAMPVCMPRRVGKRSNNRDRQLRRPALCAHGAGGHPRKGSARRAVGSSAWRTSAAVRPGRSWKVFVRFRRRTAIRACARCVLLSRCRNLAGSARAQWRCPLFPEKQRHARGIASIACGITPAALISRNILIRKSRMSCQFAQTGAAGPDVPAEGVASACRVWEKVLQSRSYTGRGGH